MTWLERWRYWRDNSDLHHRYVANGRFWWLCRDCRALRRQPDLW